MRLWRALKVENSLLWNDILSMDPDFEQKDMITRLIILKKLQITDFADEFQWHGRCIPGQFLVRKRAFIVI
jgi:hypothetical protein